jgi:GDP-4-dehydro-6-deoxy-D-mannose reductase
LRVLITGAGGFVGHHLARHLTQTYPDIDLHGTLRSESERSAEVITNERLHVIDLRDAALVRDLIARLQPDHIYHLAGQSFVQRSYQDPWETLEVNTLAQLNLFEAARHLEKPPRILITSSAEVYGLAQRMPISEDDPFMPVSPYAVSKVTQDMLGLQYFLAHGLPVVRARAFNHIGPGQDERFVAPAFAMQIARIEAGQQEPILKVGNLSDQRDFTDVRDVVRAYRLLMAKGTEGEVYNIASNHVHSIQQLLDTLVSYSQSKIEVTVDPARLRASRLPILQGDNSRLVAATGWQPTLTFEQSLRDILDDCRRSLSATE